MSDFNKKIIELLIEKKQLINNYWTSASKLYNYINDDPLLDWLDLFGKKKGYKTDEEINYEEYCKFNTENISQTLNFERCSFEEFQKKYYEFNFMKYILEKGKQYEEYVFKTLKEKYGNKIINISDVSENESNCNKFDYEKKLKKTKYSIEQNVPLIYQGLVCDPETKTFGFPDLIIREDYLNSLIYNTNVHDEQLFQNIDTNNINNTNSQKYYNYYIVDIKFHTLEYSDKCESNNIISNVFSQNQYVSQMYIYTRGLRHLIHPSIDQKTLENKAYIIGRSWTLDNKNNSIGCILFQNHEKILEKVKNGLEWYKQLKSKGMFWNPLSPDRFEMYPNMKNDKDNNWRKTKRIIAEKIGEISMIWNCGNVIKHKSHDNGVCSWKSKNFNIFDYTNDTDTSKLIDNIIKINNQYVKLYDMTINSNYNVKWKHNDGFFFVKKNNIVIDGFIDIEYVFDVQTIDGPKKETIVYMIGLYYNNYPLTSRTNNYKTSMTHKTFYIEKKYNKIEQNNYNEIINKTNEKQLIENFLLFLKNYNCEKFITWRLYYYSNVEKQTLNRLLKEYNINPEDYGITIEWIDLYELLIKNKVVFKNCFDYSLKTINNILNFLQYLPNDYIYNNTIINGLDTIIAVYKHYDNVNSHLIDEIKHYNMLDCISLYFIRDFLDNEFRTENKEMYK
jgi:hypothetical protein